MGFLLCLELNPQSLCERRRRGEGVKEGEERDTAVHQKYFDIFFLSPASLPNFYKKTVLALGLLLFGEILL